MVEARTVGPDPYHLRPILARALLVFTAWTAVGLFTVAQVSLHALAAGEPAPGRLFVLRCIADVWIWAGFTPAILRLGARFPLERGAWLRRALIHAAASLGFAVVDVLLDRAFAPLIGPSPPPALVDAFLRQSFVNVMSYWVLLVFGRAADYRRLWLERRLSAAELEAQLSDARLRALEMQLRPHFLFNALHTIAALVRAGQGTTAVRTIAQLGDLLRAVLSVDPQEVKLCDELAFVGRYLGVEAARFGDRLRVRIEADPALGGALVPRLLLQPLVENAVRHGIEASVEPGWVVVRAARRGETLRLEVEDTGPGPAAVARAGGLGLANTRARLRHLYGDRQRLDLEPTPTGGAIASVELPWREEEVRRAG